METATIKPGLLMANDLHYARKNRTKIFEPVTNNNTKFI